MKDFPIKDCIEHAKQEYPKESCGVIVKCTNGSLKYVHCKNINTNPEQDFSISPEDYLMAEYNGEIVCIVHSHPSGDATPSRKDRISQALDTVAWLIIGYNNTETIDIQWLKNENTLPLYERPFIHGVTDCYAFIRDWYRQEKNILLKDFYRSEEWWDRGENLFAENFKYAGFVETSFKELQVGDVVIMNIGSDVANHGAIYLGGNRIGHHVTNHLSCKSIYGQYYIDRTIYTLRYVGEKEEC